MLLWVNLHAGYPIGLAFIALFLIGEALEAAIGPEPWQKSAPRLKQLAAGIRALPGAGGRESQWHPDLLVPV